ncbi:MAG: hypothetical protein WC998_06965 [Candidatus Paceibacterota bacterium]|jgi:hypothetical protein
MRTKCNYAGCKKFSRAKGFCNSHYYIWKRHGNSFDGYKVRGSYLDNGRVRKKVCKIKGCNEVYYASGYCERHFSRYSHNVKKPIDSPFVEKDFERFKHPFNRTWHNMLYSCYSKGGKFNGRGITVCNRWKKSFWNFVKDMGEKPFTTALLARIDTDGNFEKKNCYWTTRTASMQRKRKRKLSTQDVLNIKKRLNLGEGTVLLAKEYKVDNSCISRIKHNKYRKLELMG